MLKKIFSFAALLVLLYSCTIQYDGGTRITAEGTALDASGNPLAGIPVIAQAYNEVTDDYVSRTVTDSRGYYRMILPLPQSGSRLCVYINKDFEPDADPRYSSAKTSNIRFDRLANYKAFLAPAKLYNNNGGNIQLVLQQPPGPLSVIKLNLRGAVKSNRIDYNLELPLGDDYPVDADNRWHNPGIYEVSPSQVLTLEYLLSDGTTRQEQITVGNQDLNYTLMY